jgi:hypothetical protein
MLLIRYVTPIFLKLSVRVGGPANVQISKVLIAEFWQLKDLSFVIRGVPNESVKSIA